MKHKKRSKKRTTSEPRLEDRAVRQLEKRFRDVETALKRRVGRPTKPPKPGERVALGLRVTPDMKKRLERAAIKNGRSISQEAELRLERSLDVSRHLVIAQGDLWSPVLIHKGELLIALGDDPRDFPVPPGEPPHQEHIVTLTIEGEDLKRLRNYFGGAPWPYQLSDAEIQAAWIEQQIDIERGK
jgi:hypothetical protein